MALSQVQCLDDHHVNWRVSESKPEFFYSEDQRLAVEALVTQGRDAFADYLRQTGVRDFLSEPELEWIEHTAEAYRPGHEHHQKPDTPGGSSGGNITPGSLEEPGDGEVSLQYWPDRSEASVAELDLGWPEAISYRGVTRVTVYTQPPTEGHTHIKEVVRKSIAGAQKVIAVVMDVFTDVDIFRDLLDAGYRRKVPVYIIIDSAAVPSFLSMCGRADMHRGHLKNLRVRCCGGVEFFTRSAQKVRGSLSEKFLLVDGDRAISGSYSFTWSSSRLDRNLITMITGQAVETFDIQFCDLYFTSRSVSLSKVPLVDEPVPDPLPAAPAPLPASVARKLINPKYALVSGGTHASPAPSDQNSSNKNSQIPAGMKILKGRLREIIQEPPLHPGLAHLEKAYLIPYLPTWPEPDPPKDVIGFINIRDDKRANQVHLQRSERFEVSQAIRFSSPLFAPPQSEDTAGGTKKPSGNTSKEPTSPVNKQVQEKANAAPKSKDQSDVTDSSVESPQRPLPQDTPTPKEHPSQSGSTVETKPTDVPQQETPTPTPPVPKRRTLQLVIDPAPAEQVDQSQVDKTQVDQSQVTLVKMDQAESREDPSTDKRTEPKMTMTRSRLTSKNVDVDSGSNDEGSQDSTKVICDRAANDNPSSASTVSEEEFFDTRQEPIDPLMNGVSSGSGRGHRHGDGVNMMARISQSMLDLRDPGQMDDSSALLRQSQLLRRGYPSPHRNIGELFRSSRSPGRDARLQANKVILSKPGSYHRPERAAAPVIGGHRYWQGQTTLQASTRTSRSPRRRSPDPRKMDHNPHHQQQQQQQQQQPPGLLGVSLSKLSSFRNLRARGGMTQKKPTQINKAAR